MLDVGRETTDTLKYIRAEQNAKGQRMVAAFDHEGYAGWLGADPEHTLLLKSRAEHELRSWAAQEGKIPYEPYSHQKSFQRDIKSGERDGDDGWWIRRRSGNGEYVEMEDREAFERMKKSLAGKPPGVD